MDVSGDGSDGTGTAVDAGAKASGSCAWAADGRTQSEIAIAVTRAIPSVGTPGGYSMAMPRARVHEGLYFRRLVPDRLLLCSE